MPRRWPWVACLFRYGREIVTGFLGPNGSGKPTTMRMTLGLDNPTGGMARVNGKSYRRLHVPLREVGALIDAKAVHGGRSAYAHLVNGLDPAGILWIRNIMRSFAAEGRTPCSASCCCRRCWAFNAGGRIMLVEVPAGALAPWTGFAILCAWAAAALILAIVLLERRDA